MSSDQHMDPGSKGMPHGTLKAKVRLGLLRNEMDGEHGLWELACAELSDQVVLEVIDLTKDDWLDRVRDGNFNGLLTQPAGWTTTFKTLYDERTAILDRALGLPMFPSHQEILLFENKKYLSYWLKANCIPHPRTHVFYRQEEAQAFVRDTDYPLVGKTNLGAGGSGVRILRSREEAEHYVKRGFSSQGVPRSVGPKWLDPALPGRVLKKLMDPSALKHRLDQYRTSGSEVQRDKVLFQEFVPHTFEWRVVRIGDSFFAHKKLLKRNKASGSLLKDYGAPPLDLLELVRSITDRHQLFSQAVDLFESSDGSYLVNEMQCVFGQSDPHQMVIDGVPGRYLFVDGRWAFEAGDFNRYECYLLRLQYFLGTLSAI